MPPGVTTWIVLPALFRPWSCPRTISSDVRESRLPVGSSAEDHVIVHEASGDRHALLLAAGKLRRPVIEPIAEAEHRGQRLYADPSSPR